MKDPLDGDSMDWTPAMALDHARQTCEDMDPDACITIFLWRDGGNYNTRFVQSGLSMSECVSLLEIKKADIIRDYIQGGKEGFGA